MVDIGLRRGASFTFPFAAAAERLAGLAVRLSRFRHIIMRREAMLEVQHNLDSARLDDVGIARGHGVERSVARMMRFGLR